jgi:hypothetical protein
MRGLTILKRAAGVLLVWGYATLWLGKAVACALDHYQLRKEVGTLGAQYEDKLADYSGLLAEGEKIRHDRAYQVDLLKQNYGYTEPDETPIIVRVAQ